MFIMNILHLRCTNIIFVDCILNILSDLVICNMNKKFYKSKQEDNDTFWHLENFDLSLKKKNIVEKLVLNFC